jgi:hypothetical protein
MSTLPRRIFGARPIMAIGLSLALLASVLIAQPASAAIRSCRTDPVILLSNGELLQTDATIETDEENVQQVTYTLHLPVGVKVIAIVNTPSRVGDREVVKFVDDLPPYHYSTDTVITTFTPNVLSTAHTRALLRDGSASGASGDHLVIRIAPLL